MSQLPIEGAGSELSWASLTFIKTLGSGQFGEVQLMSLEEATHVRPVAVKTLLDEVHGGPWYKMAWL